jgi:CIC family chloride channel protein
MRARSRAWELVDLSWKAALVGVVAGLGAVAFRGLIGLFHNLAFTGHWSFHYDANLHTPPSPLGPLVIGVPVVGALIVAFLVQHFAPEAKGHGVPEVMDAIYYRAGKIRPVVAVIKALASSISIATGGSVGREGPIAQIGSAFGSTLAQTLRLPAWQRVTLIAAGAGGGIAATFNTPIGGVLFAVELLLVEVNARTLFPVSLAVAIATLIGRTVYGAQPSFVVNGPPNEHLLIGAAALVILIAFGLLLGACAALYTRSVYWTEDLFDRIRGGYYLRHPLGMLFVGAGMYLLLRATGHYYVQGVGYATVQDILDGALQSSALLVLLFVAKLVATSVTLGSGASGGIFSPALFLGACAGGAVAGVVHAVAPSVGLRPLVFTVAGMAGVAGASMSAELTAITMLFEMTRSYELVLPTLVTVAAAYAARRALVRERRRGHHVPQSLVTEFALAQPVEAIANHRVVCTRSDENAAELLQRYADASYFVVEHEGRVLAVYRRRSLRKTAARRDPVALGAGGDRFSLIDPHDSVRRALARLKANRTPIGLFRTADGTLSVITRASLWRALDRALELMELDADS